MKRKNEDGGPTKFKLGFFQMLLIFGGVFVLLSFKPAKMFAAEKQKDVAKTEAQAKPPTKLPPKHNPSVLDFEADVVEGERLAPNLFVQMDLGTPKMDTLMFMRKNFNDFHSIDMKRKPKYRLKGK